MDNRPNLTADAKYPIKMGRAPPRAKREIGYNDNNATFAPGDDVKLDGRAFEPVKYSGVDN